MGIAILFVPDRVRSKSYILHTVIVCCPRESGEKPTITSVDFYHHHYSTIVPVSAASAVTASFGPWSNLATFVTIMSFNQPGSGSQKTTFCNFSSLGSSTGNKTRLNFCEEKNIKFNTFPRFCQHKTVKYVLEITMTPAG